ncbi:hypothetical protein BU23DRAFT_551616 [Bimuria novae-zelandiae CBS 107.79]|uniref:Uncharacterized protein n=1 Tax=Bimuria novae-zelandiae CBS 107.79 TaxID=1447943 RepID=A0A6A5VHN0_9PLEO|nr:hypothetical protein BU23DRAFT_551616 [Bimuria novae-zelandiae CBS 107.79]
MYMAPYITNIQPRSAPRGQVLHMYACVNWDFKLELYFYNDNKEMPTVIKPPPKPCKRIYESS